MIIDDLFSMINLKKNKDFLQKLDEVNINLLDEYKSNFLQEAIAFNNNEIAFELISRWINLNHQDYKWQTCLHYLWVYNNLEIAEIILKAWWDINIKDIYGNNALWTATINSKGKNYEIVKLFLKYWWYSNDKNNYEKSPLDLAKEIWDPKLIEILNWK